MSYGLSKFFWNKGQQLVIMIMKHVKMTWVIQNHNTNWSHISLFNSAISCSWVGRDPVQQEGSCPSLEQKRAPRQKMVDSLRLLLSSMPSQCWSNLLELLNCNRVEAPQGFSNSGNKSQTLSSAKLSSATHLAVIWIILMMWGCSFQILGFPESAPNAVSSLTTFSLSGSTPPMWPTKWVQEPNHPTPHLSTIFCGSNPS